MGRSIFARVRHHNTTRRRNESGQSIVILALGFVALIAFVGIVVDVSLMFVRYSTLSRAVDSAAISAAGQMRKDRNYADVALAARQMIELHGLDPVQVKVDTCETAEQIDDGAGNMIDDPAVCRDGRKLVRVGSAIESPTVFMRLLGPQYQSIRLSAVAISETAVLDVVVIFDVSESMLHDTTYEDWTSIGYGMVYVPPVWDTENGTSISYVEPTGANPNPANQGQPLNPNGPLTSVFRISAMAGYFNTLDQEPTDPKWNQYPDLLQFWSDLLTKPQEVINLRLNYGVAGDPAPPPGIPGSAYFVDSFQYPTATETQKHPRLQCRVRFWPYSLSITIPEHIRTMPEFRSRYAGRSNIGAKWMGFAPSFDFYGCCNDPTNGGFFNPITGVFEGINDPLDPGDPLQPITPGSGTGRGDDNFSDLICQPFKQARDATAQFIEQVDFARGDRLAFVTFDRGATIIDPDGADGADESAAIRNPDTGEIIEPIKNGRTQLTHMIESRERALDTLYRHIGVRAEANFYHWKENGGGWDNFALGLTDTGFSKIKNFYETNPNFDTDGDGEPDVPLNDYPLRDNCPMQNASLTGFITLYSLWDWKWGDRDGDGWSDTDNVNLAFEPGLLRIQNPSPLSGPWAGSDVGVNQAYELWASCRGTNMGAALREANNALLDPSTTRRTGTVWVMVMLSDGAAGASDPVRLNGRKPGEGNPYELLTNPVEWKSNPAPAPKNFVKYGVAGEYGWFGLCPFGTPDQAGRTQLTRTDREPQFPFCSDTRPESRHFCVPFNGEVSNVGASCNPVRDSLGANAYGFAPGSYDNDYECGIPNEFEENLRAGNVYDVDVGDWPNETPQTCDPLYDVDDYARDWADYVGVVRSGGGDQQLPTIFTIGFGLNFKVGSSGDPNSQDYIPGAASANIPDFLGEELLRYIADIGDNNRIDTDYQQDLRDPGARGTLEGGLTSASADRFGLRGPCEDPDVKPGDGEVYTGDLVDDGTSTIDGGVGTMVRPLAPRTDCGNYYNAPDQARLTIVFNDIASRMFTRLAP